MKIKWRLLGHKTLSICEIIVGGNLKSNRANPRLRHFFAVCPSFEGKRFFVSRLVETYWVLLRSVVKSARKPVSIASSCPMKLNVRFWRVWIEYRNDSVVDPLNRRDFDLGFLKNLDKTFRNRIRSRVWKRTNVFSLLYFVWPQHCSSNERAVLTFFLLVHSKTIHCNTTTLFVKLW